METTMTQPPYVPRDDEGSASSNPTWPASQNTPTYDYGSTSAPTYGEGYDESVSSVSVGGYGSSQPSTTDVAKEQAAGVKDTAVEQGQQVAGVAKEQAGAVKDTAVEQGQHVAGVAKDQAGAVKDTALEQGQHVAGVAKEQVTKVAAEASTQLKDLLSEGLTEVRSAAASQQKRLAGGVLSLATELDSMASKSDGGPLTNYAQQASHKGSELAQWLENAEPSEVLDFLRSFARRRPGVFLGASALAGAVLGRLTRGLVANAKDEAQPALGSGYSSTSGYSATSGYPATAGYSSAPTYESSTPSYARESSYDRENISLQEIPTSGTGAAGTTDVPGSYLDDDNALGFGGTGSGGVTR